MAQVDKFTELKRVLNFYVIPKHIDIYTKKGGVKLQKAISLAVEYRFTFKVDTLNQIKKLNKNLYADIYSELEKSFS